MLTFAHAWVVALAPLPLLVARLVAPRQVSRPSVRVPFLSRLQAAGARSGLQATPSWWPMLVQIAVWLCLLAALARPQWLEPPIERSIPTRDLLLIVDLSGSMDHEDFTDADGQQVDRLTAAKGVLGDFLERREGDRAGLVVFGNSPFLQVPFTIDLALCEQLLDETEVGMAGPRTALGDALGLGIRLFENSDTPEKTIILLTDGNDTDSAVPPREAARVARDEGITIHAIAMGDPTTVGEEKIDAETLQEVAETTENGTFSLALNRDELEGVYQRLDEIETRETKTVSHRPRRDLYFWPLAAALLLSLSAQAVQLLAALSARPHALPATRLRVNPRTFELETIE